MKMDAPTGTLCSVYSQVPATKIEYQFEGPTWENPFPQMRRGITIAEPEILNEIRERATWPVRKKMHLTI